jgi:hypothetical protein
VADSFLPRGTMRGHLGNRLTLISRRVASATPWPVCGALEDPVYHIPGSFAVTSALARATLHVFPNLFIFWIQSELSFFPDPSHGFK